MAANSDDIHPTLRDGHGHADKYGTKLIDKTQKYQQKFDHAKPSEKGPAGGYDDTAIPKAPPGYTLRFTFHRAENLPFADMPSFSSDPYILATLQTDLQKRHKQDSDLRLRTPTVHRNVNPEWGTVWTVAHVPASGFHLKCRLYDEDPADHDDRLGNVHVKIDRIDDGWTGFKEREFEVKKRMGSKRAYTIRGCVALLSRQTKMGGAVYIGVENLGRSEGDGGRAYTISPLPWSQHYSPLIGLIAGTKDKKAGKNGGKPTERYNFAAIQMQLQGPVPEHLYHRYVEFKPFVAGMFTSHTLRGRILNHALHHQHARIYNYDSTTRYGGFDQPSIETTKQFLEFVNYDQGGRIFTYVITLDGQIRFTETGKEFGIDLLSKHTMHSDVSIYIAFSGEFFIRRLKHPSKEKNPSPDPQTETMPPAPENENEKAAEYEKEHEDEQKQKQSTHTTGKPERQETLTVPRDQHSSGRDSQSPATAGTHRRSPSWRQSHSPSSSTRSPAPHAEQTIATNEPTKDPSHYELIIDNDSGTYRPNAKYLGQLKKFLQHNLPGLRIATLDSQGDAEKMGKLKKEQRERKKKSGQQVTYMQNMSTSSLSSSDEEELERRAAADEEDAALAPSGLVKTQWNKVKHLAKGGDHDEHKPEAGANTTVAASTSNSGTEPTKERSPSTNKLSTPAVGGDVPPSSTTIGHQNDYSATPRPLGNGGPDSFDENDRPLSRGIDEELKRRGLEELHSSQQEEKKGDLVSGTSSPGQPDSAIGDEGHVKSSQPVPAGTSEQRTAIPLSVHQTVTSAT